jgi:hypothetical protein
LAGITVTVGIGVSVKAWTRAEKSATKQSSSCLGPLRQRSHVRFFLVLGQLSLTPRFSGDRAPQWVVNRFSGFQHLMPKPVARKPLKRFPSLCCTGSTPLKRGVNQNRTPRYIGSPILFSRNDRSPILPTPPKSTLASGAGAWENQAR